MAEEGGRSVHLHHKGLAIVPQGPYPYGGDYQPSQGVRRDVLDEVEVRQMLIEHVGHRCCWGSRPARTWKITSIKDCCDVYVGTLETFIEQRDTIFEREPYHGGEVDGRDKGPVLGVWELDLRSEFPPLFVPEKEVRFKIPHSEFTEKCSDCEGRGKVPCPTCNPGRQYGFYMANQMTQCSMLDVQWSRSVALHRMWIPWPSNMPDIKPVGQYVPENHEIYRVALYNCFPQETLTARKVSATAETATVPDEVFHRAQGVQLCNIQAYQCTPAFFADSYPLNQLSSEVVASRLPVPPSAIVISERHIISVVPVTRVTMSHRKRSFIFYVVGYGRDVFVRNYPSRFCWGLCRCFEWLGN
uniref:Uncharacterized protein n=1 Tax=Aegilops tauschii TaxID=37682 RepID=N1QQA8_AEGTA